MQRSLTVAALYFGDNVLIFRYLAKEVFTTLAGLTLLLLLIFMSNQFVHYLNRAAIGEFPAMVLLKVMLIEMPNLLVLLLPLGFYVSILLAYGRLYADSEMTVLNACGFGEGALLKMSLMMASIIFLFVLLIMTWASPHIAKARTRILHSVGLKTMIQTLLPGRFHILPDGLSVIYVGDMDRGHTEAQDIFLARKVVSEGLGRWDVLWAEKGDLVQAHDDEKMQLHNGREYQGVPGQANYQVAKFEAYTTQLPAPTVSFKSDMRTYPMRLLWPWHGDAKKAAEFQWRLSVPLMVLVLTLIAVPLSRLNPRQGKYAKLFPAMIIFILYANFMFVARDWVALGKVPIWIGMSWLHLVFISLGLFLLRHNRKQLA